MPDSPPTDQAAPTDPDGQAVFHALTQPRPPSGSEVYNAIQGIRNMSGQTVAAEIAAHRTELGAEIRAQNAKFEAKLDAQNTKFDELRRENSTLRWMLGLGFTVLGILIAILALVLK